MKKALDDSPHRSLFVCARRSWRAQTDSYKVLRVLLTQMPMVQQAAALEQVDVLEAADGMIELIEKGLFRLFVHADGGYELVATDQ